MYINVLVNYGVAVGKYVRGIAAVSSKQQRLFLHSEIQVSMNSLVKKPHTPNNIVENIYLFTKIYYSVMMSQESGSFALLHIYFSCFYQ